MVAGGEGSHVYGWRIVVDNFWRTSHINEVKWKTKLKRRNEKKSTSIRHVSPDVCATVSRVSASVCVCAA